MIGMASTASKIRFIALEAAFNARMLAHRAYEAAGKN
jgi:hypothetical protein